MSTCNDFNPEEANILDGYDYPAIMVGADYKILATNQLYRDCFGEISNQASPYCYKVSHGYDLPCDKAGESCPLSAALESGQRERVLHIHQTPRGREHVDVELLPIKDSEGKLRYFVELLKPVPLAGAEDTSRSMVGSSKVFNRLLEKITRVGPGEAAVLLLGESGTGKELAAHAIHQASPRSKKPMVTLECAGLTESLFESELFGHVKGAFTGASHHKQGLVEAADGGTLFLDEIADVPLALQVKLLRLIETGCFRPVGSRETRCTNFRLICATHKNIFELVEREAFRQDLFYRINVFPIHLPSLNERRDDIPLITKAILERIDRQAKFTLTNSAMLLLQSHYYRGNVRELRNILSRAIVLSNTNVIDRHVIQACLEIDLRYKTHTQTFVDLKTHEQQYLLQLLDACNQDKEKVAKIANISLRSLYRKLQDMETRTPKNN